MASFQGGLRLPTDVLEYVRRRAGMQPPGLLDGASLSLAEPAATDSADAIGATDLRQSPPPMIAPDGSSSGRPPPPDDAAPAQPSELQRLMQTYKQYVSDYSPAQLAAAQARDRASIESHRFAENMGNATGLLINHPGAVKFAAAVPLEVQNFLARREFAKDQIGTQTQMLQMDPVGPMAQAKIRALRAAGLDLPEGTSPMVADAYLGALKSGVDVAKIQSAIDKDKAETATAREGLPKVRAEGRLANANATASEIENGPAAPAMLAMGKKLGIALPPSTTNKQARETIDVEAKRQGLAVDWAKVGLEKRHLDVEEKHYRSDHPDEPVPGYVFAGPPGTAAPGRDSPEVQTLGEKVAASGEMKTTLAEMKEIYDRTGTAGRIIGPDATRLDQLHEKLLGTIGRAASGGKLAAYDITLAHEQLPRPSDIRGALQTKNIHAAIDQLTKDADLGHREWAKAHNFAPKGGGGDTAPTVLETRTAPDGRKLEKLSDGTVRVAK